MKLFVTGGTGFVGSNFVNTAMRAGHEIVALRRAGSVPRVSLGQEPSWVEGALDSDLREGLKGCDALVHLAAHGVVELERDWKTSFYWNAESVLGLCEQAHEAGIKYFIMGGSCFEYGRSAERYEFIPIDAPLEPVTVYGATKAAASVLLQGWAADRKVSMQLMRIFHVYGEGEAETRLWPSLHQAAISGADFEMTLGGQIRDFVYVKDVSERLVEALSFDSVLAGQAVIKHVGSGNPTSILEFSTYWWNKWEAKGKLRPGAIPYRVNEVMRYVPEINETFVKKR